MKRVRTITDQIMQDFSFAPEFAPVINALKEVETARKEPGAFQGQTGHDMWTVYQSDANKRLVETQEKLYGEFFTYREKVGKPIQFVEGIWKEK